MLARKWRPRTFTELVGQSHVVRPLVNALDSDRIHHAFLFTGTRGVGKTTVARILAKSLNCEKGVSSQPCGECGSCTAVDEGRFVDLIEVDAASRTKVDDTRELLDNVQYAPTSGRYKVYLIDEVHMLSGHSFNALLKTLEEPPPHVKFLLATTDPQKLPVTILSRCLQFGLKRLTVDAITGQLKKILEAENIEYDQASIDLLARAADGSMRDGLSLLDQAIAFGDGKVTEAEVREMLGTIDQSIIDKLLTALGSGDAAGLIKAVAEVTEYGGDYGAVLDSLLLDLYHISLAQIDSKLVNESVASSAHLHTYTDMLSPENIQLYYQIGLHGKRDLYLAPDPKTGLEMALLRMLAFKPAEIGRSESVSKPVRQDSKVDIKSTEKSETESKTEDEPVVARSNGNWTSLIAQLNISGILAQLARHTSLESESDGTLTVVLDEAYAQLHTKPREAEFEKALEDHYGHAIKLVLKVEKPKTETPAAEQQRENDERQQAAEEAIASDPNVQALQESFNARVDPGSVRSRT